MLAATSAGSAHHPGGGLASWPYGAWMLGAGLGALVLLEIYLLTRRGGHAEMAWAVGPLAGVAAIFFLVMLRGGSGAMVVLAEDVKPADPLVVRVLARQYAWQFTYPTGVVSTGELHVPEGRDVVLDMQSADVLHSFDVPRLDVRRDIPRGANARLVVRPQRGGRYEIICATQCGNEAEEMAATLVIENAAAFETWLQGKVERKT